MRLLKWIFHPVYLLLIFIAFVIYVNRNALFTDTNYSGDVKNVVEKVDSLINAMQVESQPPATGDTGRVQSVVGDEAAGIDFPPQNTAIPDKQNASRPETSVSSVETSATASAVVNVQPNVEEGKKSETESIDTVTNPPETSGAAKLAPNEPDEMDESHDNTLAAHSPERTEEDDSDETMDEVHKEASRPFPAVSSEQLLRTWQQARIAAWYGDFDSAIEYYQTVIALQPDNYDAYGEMGNVMLRAGNREGAAEAYYQAALLLNNTPYRSMAWHLLNVLVWLSPSRAEKLHQEIIRP